MVMDIHFGWFQDIPSFTRSLPAKRSTVTKINFAVTTIHFFPCVKVIDFFDQLHYNNLLRGYSSLELQILGVF